MGRPQGIGIALIGVAGMLAAWQTPPVVQPQEPPATTQPAEKTYRNPREGEILKRLIQQKNTPVILPAEPGQEGQMVVGDNRRTRTDPELLLEGTILFERPGRLMRDDEQAEFEFLPSAEFEEPKTMVILRNQLLEAMEEHADRGITHFTISAEVTRYRGENFLLLKKVIKHLPNGNIAP